MLTHLHLTHNMTRRLRKSHEFLAISTEAMQFHSHEIPMKVLEILGQWSSKVTDGLYLPPSEKHKWLRPLGSYIISKRIWLVVEPPLWKILVNWDDYPQYVPNHQPGMNWQITTHHIQMFQEPATNSKRVCRTLRYSNMAMENRWTYTIFNGRFRILNWRYLPYIRPMFQAYVSGDIPPTYGLKYGTKVPPSVGSWRSPIKCVWLGNLYYFTHLKNQQCLMFKSWKTILYIWVIISNIWFVV